MKKNLAAQAFVKFFSGLIFCALMIFLPAGSLSFYNGWLFLALLFIPMFLAGLIMLCKNPELLRKRLQAKEEQGAQKTVIILSGLMFIGGFILCGLNYRFSWLILPDWLVITASVIFLISYCLYAEVLRENAYLSRTVEIQENQRVVDTGLYSLVRHPMYAVTVLLFLSMPLILGSIQAFILFLLYPLLLIKRIKNEELLLSSQLEGYKEYMLKVKDRLIPFVW